MKPKYFIQFLDRNLKGETVDAMGSDGVFILDGRNHVDNMTQDGLKRFERIKSVKPWYIGFKVCYGTFSNYEILAHKLF